jgi:Flp pilus assembly protein TadB
VAQTKRRRRTKHRGNAAGVIEARGRTGRKPTAAEKGGKVAEAARAKEKRLNRYDRPPTWSGAMRRALVAALALLVLSLLLIHSVAQAIVYFVFALLAYTPISYYTDVWMYRRRQRSKQKRGQGKAAPR